MMFLDFDWIRGCEICCENFEAHASAESWVEVFLQIRVVVVFAEQKFVLFLVQLENVVQSLKGVECLAF